MEVANLSFCGSCGAAIPREDRVCPECARPVREPHVPAPSNSRVLFAVLASVAAVAVLLFVAAIAANPYGLVGGVIPGNRPAATLTLSSQTSAGVDVMVVGMQPATPPGNFKLNVEDVSIATYGVAVGMPTSPGGLVSVSVGSGAGPTVFSIQWLNPGGSGQVSQGDHFVISPTGSYPPGIVWSFLLIWSDGSTLTSVSWTG